MSSTALVVPQFDYEAIAPADREAVVRHTQVIRSLGRKLIRDIIELGKSLLAVKELLPHGQFLNWLGAEFGMDSRTAQNFMQVASSVKNENISELGIAPTAL